MGRNKLSRQKQQLIALGKFQGKTQKEICAMANVSLGTEQHAMQRYPEVRSMMEQFAEKHRAKLEKIGAKMIASLETDVSAEDYWSRADAGRRYIDIVKSYDEVKGFGKKESSVTVNVNQNTISLGDLMQIAAKVDGAEGE